MPGLTPREWPISSVVLNPAFWVLSQHTLVQSVFLIIAGCFILNNELCYMRTVPLFHKKDDDIEEGDLPEHKRPSAPVDFSQIDPGKPESILKMTKKGKTLMMFVTVSGSPTEKETEEITSLWQGSLFNANYDVQRFIVGSDRAIFMLRDGSYAWEIKDFLVSQDRCADVTLEGQVYPGKGGGSKEKNKTKQEKGKKKKEGDPKPRASKEGNRAGNKREDL
uniref:LRP chaperone MESD isoform X2 n=1 Tax=Ictidomys tridecemlineatus TaxID=43179 RepID=UPI001A9F6478|nr:LRP chaperone MESD isoform X2 [Ictidomys tridecemlineatus]